MTDEDNYCRCRECENSVEIGNYCKKCYNGNCSSCGLGTRGITV